ncbi:MAG: type II secretion system protein [Candidatus Omnitrophota bacterium]
MNKLKAFTLVEILIVVAIIAMLATLTIPNLLRARLNANEAVAQGTLKSIATGCENFRASQVALSYAANLNELTSANPAYLDATVDTATIGVAKNGYNFTYTRVNLNQYVCCATPDIYQVSGIRTFAINETGLLRAMDNGAVVINTTAEYEALDVVN